MKHNDYFNDSQHLLLGWGYVDESIFPNNILRNALQYGLDKYSYGILQYENSSGLDDLKKEIANWAPSFYNISTFGTQNLTITNGITNALDMVGRLLCKNIYNAFTIEPCYDTAIESLKRNAKSIVSIKCIGDDNGSILLTDSDFLRIEDYFATKNIKIFYVVPNYSNPTGLTISLDDRIKLGNLCRKYNVMIFEDNPYGLYSYNNQKIKSFYELYPDITLFANSFSKIGFPGLRIGFLIGNENIIQEYAILQKYAYSSPNLITQSMVEYLLKKGIMDDIFQKRFKIMMEKYILVSQFLQENFSKSEYIAPTGGFYFWINTKMDNFSELANKKGLILVPGKIYGHNYDFSTFIRIAFSQIKKEDLPNALNILKSI